MSKFVKLSFVLSFILGMSAIAFGQSTVTGSIGGLVTNPNKEVVPNAAVTVRNTETNKEDSATSDDQGRFKVAGLTPGTYAVTVNGTGFSPYTQEATVEIGRETNVNAALTIGPVSGGTVEVTSEAPVINTSQQDFSSNINQTSINELPINGRRWSNFALLSPGTVPDGNFGLISFRGISGLLNNSTVDGGDNNQAFFSEERGRTRLSYSTSQSAVREFQVNTSNYSAEYGRAAGGVVNTVTKSGTNEFHGQLFYYQRNNKWGARNPLAFQSVIVNGVPDRIGIKPLDVRHQFGGNIGGPIVKNKVFFFFNYDQQKRNFPGLGIFSTPGYLTTVSRCTSATAPGCTAALFTASLLNPTRGLTDAQIDSTLSFINSLTGTVPRRGDQKIFFPKLDWNITDNHSFTASYNRVRWVSPAGIQTQATNTRGRASFGDDFVEIDAVNLRLASTLSPTLLNEARFQWARDNEFQNSQPPLPGEPTTGLNGRSPDVFLTNGIEFGKPTFLERNAFPDEKRKQFADTVTYTSGNHTLKWGGDLNYVKDLQSNLFQEGGAYSYSNINDFIVDYVNFTSSGALRTAGKLCGTGTRLAGRCYTSNYNQGFGQPAFEFATTDLAYFIQDDWRVNPRLTLNLGLRWEYERTPTPFLVGPVLQSGNRPDDKDNFGPRVGFAYDLNGDGKTSLRGGYGIYYGRIINSTILAGLINTGNPAGQVQVSLNPASSPATPAGNTAAPIFPNVLTTAPAGSSSVVFFNRDFSNPQIHQLDVIVEREIARNTVVSASYLASFGNGLPNFVDTNLNPPTSNRQFEIVGGPFDGQVWNLPYFAGARPNPAFGALTEIRSDIRSKYHALVLQANRRLTNGLQFQSSWTFSRSWDTGQGSQTNSTTNVPFNAFDQSAEGALSSFDRRHKFVTSLVYNTHFFAAGTSGAGHAILDGWTIAPIFNVLSGPRYTGTVSGNANTLFNAGFASNPGGLNGSNGSTRFALVPRNFFKQPKIVNTDLRISRRFNLGESMNLELLAEGFNIFNRTQVSGVNTSIYTASIVGTAPAQRAVLTYNPTFGTVNEAGATLFRERQIQLAARFEF
ncbi:MAG TPA: TonB-dependent receptor [Pyrinomonadaceae bacterium]|nr:TonB-dependent receptor [Pyrinomonadaceae bacterium]